MPALDAVIMYIPNVHLNAGHAPERHAQSHTALADKLWRTLDGNVQVFPETAAAAEPVERPVFESCPRHDVVDGQRAPDVGVVAVVAVVPIDKHVRGRDCEGCKRVGRGLGRERLLARLAIDNELAILDLSMAQSLSQCKSVTFRWSSGNADGSQLLHTDAQDQQCTSRTRDSLKISV